MIPPAYAAEGASAGGSSLGTLLFLLGAIATAYLLAHLVLERAQQRFLFVSGAEYVVLGVVLGPSVFPELAPLGNLTSMGPVFAFAAGWVGLLYGLELEVPFLRDGWRPARIAVSDALVTGALVTAGAVAFFRSGWLVPLATPADAWANALLLGSCAAAGSTSAIDLLASRYGALETDLLPLLRRASRMGDLVALFTFGLVFCWFHQGVTLTAEAVRPEAWVGFTVGLGLVLGVLFFLFVGRDPDDNTVFLGMVGILLFASGAAFFLDLSAVVVNLVLGLVLAQTALGARLRTELERTAKPTSLVLLLFAGALWHPVPLVPGLAVVAGFLGLRLVGKVLGSVLGTVGTPLRLDLFRGLMAQGNAAVAMAVSFRIVYDGPIADLAYTAVLIGVVTSELFSPRLVRGLLVDAGELGQDLGPVGRVS